jgi:polar amino acid transport system substrate-binding protein
MKYFYHIVSFLLFFIINYQYIHSHTDNKTITDKEKPTERILRVGLAGNEPFVFVDDNSGIAIEIWEEIADDQSWDYGYTSYNSVDEAIMALRNGDIDLVVGPISITAERLVHSDFSQPFYNSSVSILSRIQDKGLWERVKPFFSLELLYAVGVLVLVLAIVGTLLWLAERKDSPEQFPDSIAGGVGTGMWLAIVTMTTTGYGDKAPVTVAGRIITSVWMIVSIVSATSLVAGIASTLSLSAMDVSTVSTVEQLTNKRAGTIAGSTSEMFLDDYGVAINEYQSLSEAVEELEKGNVDAVVFDRPQLLYYLKENDERNLILSKAEYYKQGYGFAFPSKSGLDYEVNRNLLELAEDQKIAKIIHSYIKRDE